MYEKNLFQIFSNISHAVIQIYGHPGSGKTSFLLSLMSEITNQGKRVFYIDSPHKLSSIKLNDVLKDKANLEKVTIFRPKDILELIYTIDDLDIFNIHKSSLVLIDDPLFLYSPKETEKTSNFKQNERISMIFAFIYQLSKHIDLPIFVSNQVRGKEGKEFPFSENKIKRYIHYNMYFIRDKGTNLVWASLTKGESHLANYRLALIKEGITVIKEEKHKTEVV